MVLSARAAISRRVFLTRQLAKAMQPIFLLLALIIHLAELARPSALRIELGQVLAMAQVLAVFLADPNSCHPNLLSSSEVFGYGAALLYG